MIFRVARHTNDLDEIKKFYTEVLGLELLGSFEKHENYAGIFLGKVNTSWHLEFTASDEPAVHSFDEDDLLVFYPETQFDYDNILKRIDENNIQFIQAKNPYWNQNGKHFLDPDGYGIIISPLKIKS